MGTPLISLDDVKTQLAIRAGNTDFDERLGTLINATSLLIEGKCRRSFARQTYEDICHVQSGAARQWDLTGDSFDGTNLHASSVPFRLSQGPLVDPATVRMFYDRNHEFGEATELPATSFTVLGSKGLVYVKVPLVKSRDSVKLVYEAGYTVAQGSLSASLPADLKLAVITQVLYFHKKLDQENLGMTTEGDTKPQTFLTEGGLLPDVVHLIAPYLKLLRGRE